MSNIYPYSPKQRQTLEMMFLPDISHSFMYPSTFVKWFQAFIMFVPLFSAPAHLLVLGKETFFFVVT